MLRFVYIREPEWPPLAWLARCHSREDAVAIFHGPRVETHTEWFHEAVWDGDFDQGGFDEADIVFGSRGRLRGDAIRFVTSGSTLDRLRSLTIDTCAWVSDSLACLTAALGAKVELGYTNRSRDFQSISKGLDDYRRESMTSAGPVRLTCFHDLRSDGRRLLEEAKPFPKRDFSTFERYRSFLTNSTCRLANKRLVWFTSRVAGPWSPRWAPDRDDSMTPDKDSRCVA